MTILVTGFSGFFGSHIVRRFLKEGERTVCVLHRRKLAAYQLRLLKPYMDKEIFVLTKGDILNLPRLVKIIEKFDVRGIVHAAAFHGSSCKQKPLECLKVNVEGTANILEAARLTKLGRVVHISSRAVYPSRKGISLLTEDTPPEPIHGSVYGLTKAAADMLGLEYAYSYGVDFVTCRFPAIYGPGMSYSQSLIHPIVMSAVMGKPFKLPQGGDQAFEYLYIRDAVTGVVLAYNTTKLEHRIYNIGTSRLTKLFELAQAVEKSLPGALIELGSGALSDKLMGIPLGIRRARQELGYEPKYTVERGVAEYIEFLKGTLKMT